MITNDEHINIKFLCLNVRVRVRVKVRVRVRVCIDKIMREIQRGLNNKVKVSTKLKIRVKNGNFPTNKEC